MTCTLPGGLWDASDVLHREVELVPLTGGEEELLADRTVGGAVQVTTVLSRCVRRIGSLQPITEQHARELLVGDRQYLLMKLRQLTFGDQIAAGVRCPWPDCGESMDMDFMISELPLKSATSSSRVSTLELSAAAAAASGLGSMLVKIEFRLPNGADQEALAPLLAGNEAEVLTRLLARCLVSIGTVPTRGSVQHLSPAARLEIERAMEAAAPGIDLTLEAQCSECGRAFAAPFDAQDFILGEVRGNRDLLLREIHYLAYHYHWSERDILAMPRERRREYIDILADEMERRNHAVA